MTTQPTLTPGAFAAKWQGTPTTEKAGSQEHFIDLDNLPLLIVSDIERIEIIIGLPIALLMFNRTPFVASLYRY